eukprot:TRINITY_DN69940_c0_g1_i1.p1 TRINITY_DN69940_c0_g1~~TRINITY_DN69940_c0_g1_i1.p1  ORF type:complete len:354 (+),score=93.82 TRINITY_DN69940_c0_g1_i1:111-1172(+)
MANGGSLSMEYLVEVGILSSGTSAFQTAPAAPPAEKPAGKTAGKQSKPAIAPHPPAPTPVEPPKELTADELKTLSKEERKAYHQARLAAGVGMANVAKKPMTKEERRAMQEAQRKVKDDKKETLGEQEALLAELKLQGLSEDQARVLMAEMKGQEGIDHAENEDEDDEEDLFTSVKTWMAEHGEQKTNKESIRDFNMKVRFQGHVDSTPPDHLTCILQVMVDDACARLDLAAAKPPQPAAVAKSVTRGVKQWCGIISSLYDKIGDVFEAANIVVQTVIKAVAKASGDVSTTAKDCASVGILMAVREEIEVIADEELLSGFRKLESPAPIIAKYIKFLEEEVEEGSDDSDSDED